MSEIKSLDIAEKVEKLADSVNKLNFRLKRATKFIKHCRESFKSTLPLIGEINERAKER
jgi:hypothetical protein